MNQKDRESPTENIPLGEQQADIPGESGLPDAKHELVPDFLMTEYSALIELYTHTENALSSTFNFYLTLLSAAVGAILVLAQLPGAGGGKTFSVSGLLLGFAVLLGIITQDGIVNKNVDLAHYALSINLLKAHLLSKAPEPKSYVFYLRNIHAQVKPFEIPLNIVDRLHKRLWWIIPLGTHQLFVNVINSLALTALAVIIVPGMLSLSVPLWRKILSGSIGFYVCFVAHCIYAQAKFRRGFKKLKITMTGKAPEW
jgi:hypothetical protein